MVQVAPSILSADFSCLGADIVSVDEAGADLIHMDVMDGHFVPNLTFGPMIVRDVRRFTNKPLDVHLMVEKPSGMIDAFAKAGADMITVHLECAEKPEDLIAQIKKHKIKAGISIKPNTKVADVIPYIPMVDLILVMSVEPGAGGQAFMENAIQKISELKCLIGKKKVLVSVDGGINHITAPACILAGVDILVAGNYVFGNDDRAEAIRSLKTVVPFRGE